MPYTPPPEVAAAAAIVQRFINTPIVKPRDEIDRMTPAQKLDYAGQFDQTKMPAWKDPRG